SFSSLRPLCLCVKLSFFLRELCALSVLCVMLFRSSSLSSLERRRPLLQKRLGPFPHIFRRARHAKQRRLQKQSFFQRHLHASLNRFHCEFHRQWPVRNNFFRHRFGR